MLLGSPSLIQENEVRQVSVGKAVACTGAIFGVCAAGMCNSTHPPLKMGAISNWLRKICRRVTG